MGWKHEQRPPILMGQPRGSTAVIEPSETHSPSDETLRSEDEAQVQQIRTFVGTCAILLPPGAPVQVSLVVLIPLYYNPAGNGVREPVGRAKLSETEAEMRQHFSGYSRSTIDGWYRENDEEFSDQLLRYEILFVPDNHILSFLAKWKHLLEARFHQLAIYTAFTGPVISW